MRPGFSHQRGLQCPPTAPTPPSRPSALLPAGSAPDPKSGSCAACSATLSTGPVTTASPDCPTGASCAHLFTRYEQHAQPTVVALVDLDRFKTVNDTHGHSAGDQLLRVTAQRIHTIARAHGGVAARLGGDEFLILLPVIGGDTDAGIDAVLHAITRPVTVTTEHGDRLLCVQASAGSTVYHGTGPIAAQLYQADIALYQAKQNRGGHCRYRPDMHMPDTGPSGVRLRDRHAAPAEDGTHR